MKMKVENGMIYIIEVSPEQNAIFKSWSQIRYNRVKKWYEGLVSAELLNKMARNWKLPPVIEEERRRFNLIQEAVDRERVKPDEELRPMAKYPVKKKLFKHQMRAANMALLTFGLVDPEEVKA